MKNEREVIANHVPEAVKEVVNSYQTHKLAEKITGLTDFSFDKISEYLGGRLAARRLKWGPVADGLVALHNLKR